MIIGIPKEVKDNEYRVGMVPAGVRGLVEHGHAVLAETDAGTGSGFSDKDYQEVGAKIVDSAAEVYGQAEMVVKVKEPIACEYDYFRPGLMLFTFLHLAAEAELAHRLIESEVIGIAYETVQTADGKLPLLTPMSEIAGRISVQVGAHYLERTHGGAGMLLGGVPGVRPCEVVIVGGGVVGTNAAKMAVGLGAQVTILDKNAARLRQLDDIFRGRVKTIMSNQYNIAEAVAGADLLVGAILIPGEKAPQLVTEKMVKTMKPGSLIVDVAIDQGGAIETIDRITTHSEPVYEKYGVLHYSVANMPGSVPRTSTFALTNVTLPYVMAIADKGFKQAMQDDPALALGVNTIAGRCTCKGVVEAVKLTYVPLENVLMTLK